MIRINFILGLIAASLVGNSGFAQETTASRDLSQAASTIQSKSNFPANGQRLSALTSSRRAVENSIQRNSTERESTERNSTERNSTEPIADNSKSEPTQLQDVPVGLDQQSSSQDSDAESTDLEKSISPTSIYSFQRDGLPTLEQQRQLRAMPIEQRPYRPLHFYGNTVRRRMGK